ncbi:hypothetical protein B0H12DRAFT_484226 [Mycena haematopus]|nr:hypothetical protein B0H12DRAFT_484226 [Mycena haematopus]
MLKARPPRSHPTPRSWLLGTRARRCGSPWHRASWASRRTNLPGGGNQFCARSEVVAVKQCPGIRIIYHGALEANAELAEKEGQYETYESSLLVASRGELQYDMWDHTERAVGLGHPRGQDHEDGATQLAAHPVGRVPSRVPVQLLRELVDRGL